MKGYLVLEDGTICDGIPFSNSQEVLGEVVFCTGMTGYQESLTDPSYCGQILVASYPLIGNYGTSPEGRQSSSIQVRGYVVREICSSPSHRASEAPLEQVLANDGVPGLSGVDTRSVIRRLRDHGTMRGGMTTGDPNDLLEKVRAMEPVEASNLVAVVSTREAVTFDSGKERTVAVIDCGVKRSILDELRSRFNVVLLPFDTDPRAIRDLEPDGLFITNGPGDPSHPEVVGTTVATLRALRDEFPMMGICLGNQLLAISLGAKTFKLKFGHRGINQPVGHDGRVFITSQNHGFAVDADSAADANMEVTFRNLNDGTVEGLRHAELPIFSVQFHPEAHAGPRDTTFLFDHFRDMMEGR